MKKKRFKCGLPARWYNDDDTACAQNNDHMHISKEKQANNYTCTKITYYRHHS